MERVIETKASTLLQFIHGLRGDLQVTFEEGTWAGWLYDLLKPHVTELLVCNPRKIALLKDGSKSDRIDAHKLADLLYMNKIKPVYHGEHGLRMLKELSRSYLTITKDLGRVMNRLKALYRSWAISLCRDASLRTAFPFGMVPARLPKLACAGERNFTTNNSTLCGWCANKPGKSCWPRLGSTVPRSYYARFLVLVRFERRTW